MTASDTLSKRDPKPWVSCHLSLSSSRRLLQSWRSILNSYVITHGILLGRRRAPKTQHRTQPRPRVPFELITKDAATRCAAAFCACVIVGEDNALEVADTFAEDNLGQLRRVLYADLGEQGAKFWRSAEGRAAASRGGKTGGSASLKKQRDAGGDPLRGGAVGSWNWSSEAQRARKKGKTGPLFNAMGKRSGRYKDGRYCIGAPEAVRKARNAERSRTYYYKQKKLQG